jgi:aminoglycoside phosphotransferase (APT) family kinase protein
VKPFKGFTESINFALLNDFFTSTTRDARIHIMTADVAGVSASLATYLGAEIARIAVLGSGWETTIYEFTISARSSRTPDLPIRSPLVLRLYDGAQAEDKAAREGRTLSWLAGAGYPVPRPYVREQGREALGAPFIVMDRLAGGPLFSATSFPLAFKTFSMGFVAFVRAQVRLHRIDVGNPNSPDPPNPDDLPRADSDPSPAATHAPTLKAPLADAMPRAFSCASIPATAPLLERLLGIIAERVANGPLPGLEDALASLRERADRHRAAPDTPPGRRDALASLREHAGRHRIAPDSIVHMDYHPQNVIVRGIRVTGVIDWVSADRGDRHLDAATTSAILATSAMDRPRWMRDNRVGNSLRALFAALYFPAYHALAPMDLDRFRYCQAVAAMYRLSTFGMMVTRGPASVGFRPEAIANVTPDAIRLLTRYASRKAGTPVTLDSLCQPEQIE